jgi:hypothetical protein
MSHSNPSYVRPPPSPKKTPDQIFNDVRKEYGEPHFTTNTVEKLLNDFSEERQATRRIRALQVIAGILLLLLVGSKLFLVPGLRNRSYRANFGK